MKELIKISNNGIEMTSRDIAEWFDKRHDHVMRDIRDECQACEITIEKDNPYFGESYYMNSQNKKQPQYHLSKKGILLISARYDSKVRLALIEKIEELENRNNMPTTYIQALEKLLSIEKEKQLLLQQNEDMKPKVDFFDAVADSKDAIEMSQVAKVLGISGYGRNNLFEFLRENNILRNNNEPYQTFVDRGYFRVIEQKYIIPTGETKISIKTLVYQKGLDYIRKMINS